MSSDKKVYFERELKNELPIQGKMYRQIGDFVIGDVYAIGEEFIGETGSIGIVSGDIINTKTKRKATWAFPEMFSESFVELIEVEVGDFVAVKDEVLRQFSLHKYIDTYVKVINKSKLTPPNCVNVNISHNPEGGLNVRSEDIKSIKKQIKPKPISVEKSPYLKTKVVENDFILEEMKENLKQSVEDYTKDSLDIELKLSQPIGGVKHDKGKLPLFTLIFSQFPLAIQEVCKRTEVGHQKYLETDQDYQNFSRVDNVNDRYKNAALRHMMEQGEDQELVGTTHEAAVIWNLLADYELKLRKERGEK